MKRAAGSGPKAGGVAIALLSVAGVVIGSLKGQPSLGFLIGVGAGVAVAVAVWLWDRGGRQDR